MSNLIKQVDITDPHQIAMSPDVLAVCQHYLTTKDTAEIAHITNIPETEVRTLLMRADAKAYINSSAFAIAERNIDTIQDRFENLIENKLEEMEESELGSKHDIADLLEKKAKIEMDLIKLRLKLVEAETKRSEAQAKQIVNMQINNAGNETPGYEKLISALLEKK